MISIKMNAEEAEAMERLLLAALSDLHTEISHTDDREYRAMLKKRALCFRRVTDEVHEQRMNELMHATPHHA